MIIGVPSETKEQEGRVGLVPAGVEALTRERHKVLVQAGAGAGAGISDEEMERAGAEIVAGARDVYGRADLILKVKEPQEQEYPLIRRGQILFTYLHFAASRKLLDAMLQSGAHCLAYETLEGPGGLPLLTPMSEVAGRMAIQVGAHYLECPHGGRGVLLGGVPGVEPGRVLVLGAGVVGTHAARMAAGLGARVTLMDINLERLRHLSGLLPANVTLVHSSTYAIRERLRDSDLLVGAVLVHGARAPVLVAEEDLKLMQPGSVVVDVAVDQGGCIETCRPTTHADPVYTVHGVLHYSVANMPGAVSRTSTFALTNATLPYARRLAAVGLKEAVRSDPQLATAANVLGGRVTHEGVARTFGLAHVEPAAAL